MAKITSNKDPLAVLNSLKDLRKTFKAPVDIRIEKNKENKSEEFKFVMLMKMIIGVQTREEIANTKIELLKTRGSLCIESILASSEESLASELQGVSYHRKKAAYIKQTTEMISSRFCGRVPDNYEDLVSLPGIGSRSANMFLTIIQESPKGLIVDSNIHRIVNRIGLVSTSSAAKTEKELKNLIPAEEAKDYYINLLGFCQVYCHPHKPDCQSCPLSSVCLKKGLKST